ncbi:MAG TPA: hypothetical protein VFV52_14005 [Bacilli bacterium]|nr:hypothetical protein [Bacilli bacterium]
MSRITFSPEGWRGLIAQEFTFANVAVIAQAVALYVETQGAREQGIIVGYDQDCLSHLFAERAAEVLAGNGIRTLLLDSPKRKEEVASYVLFGHLAGALMLLGTGEADRYSIQYVPAGAGLLTCEQAAAINHLIYTIEAGTETVRVTPYTRGIREGRIQKMML